MMFNACWEGVLLVMMFNACLEGGASCHDV